MRDVMAICSFAARVLQTLFLTVLVAGAAGLALSSALAALGHLPWLRLPLHFGEGAPVEAGMAVQLGVTLLALGLLSYLPSHRRILALETSHRTFSLHMQDVARAYEAVHAADRDGMFQLSREFDATKERIAWLRDHPDLSLLEPDVLEVAAQMGVISRELAEIYATDKVARARTFLTQRQEEIARFEARLAEAKAVANEIRNWAARVALDEDVARSEIARLREMFDEAMARLGDPEGPVTGDQDRAPDPALTWASTRSGGDDRPAPSRRANIAALPFRDAAQ